MPGSRRAVRAKNSPDRLTVHRMAPRQREPVAFRFGKRTATPLFPLSPAVRLVFPIIPLSW